jgi:hypothetical protein
VRNGSDGVARIIAGEHFVHSRRVLDGAAHRAAAVAREGQRHDAGAAHQLLRRYHTDQRTCAYKKILRRSGASEGERAEGGELNQLEAAAALGTRSMTILPRLDQRDEHIESISFFRASPRREPNTGPAKEIRAPLFWIKTE